MLKKLFISFITMFVLIFAFADTVQSREITEVPHWQKKVINVYIPKDGDKKAASMLKSAFGQWQSASSGKIRFKYVDENPADIDIVFAESASGSAGPFTKTSVTKNGNDISKAEITVATENKQYKTYPNSYVSKVFLHEVGKALGLPTDTRKPSSIMHSPVTEKQKLMKIDVIKLYSINGWSYSTRRIDQEKED